ncbi:MAG: hypothetical protein V1843_04340, partial [bacterium]
MLIFITSKSASAETIVELSTAEALTIQGSKTITFTQRTLEGTKEGFTPGTTREETLKVNVRGNISEDVKLDANILSTSTVSDSEEKLSIALSKGPYELYFGDFLSDLNDTEFTKLNRNLSGMRLKADLKRAKFTLLYSTPKGTLQNKKFYGNRTQGPYNLGATSKIVIDSDEVRLDGAKQKKGEDYDIDYNAGTITFRNKIIDLTQVIEVNFEERDSIYSRTLYAYRGFVNPNENFSLGLTYLSEADSLDNAASIQSQTGINPISQNVFGLDGFFNLGPLLELEGEAAISQNDINTLDNISPVEGKAAKIKTTSRLGAFTLSTDLKRIGAAFIPLSEADPKKDVWSGGGALSFVPVPQFFSQIDYKSDSYIQDNVPYSFKTKRGKLDIAPENLPSLSYQYWQEDATNDYVSGGVVDRTKTRNAGKISHRLGALNLSLQGAKEIWEDRAPSQEVTTYNTAQFGIATMDIKNLTATANFELKETIYPAGNKPITKTYNLNAEVKPHTSFNLNALLKFIDDSEEGSSSLTDLTYKYEPVKSFNHVGKYTIQTLEEDFSGTSEAVSRHTGSFQFTLIPLDQMRLKYYFKPTFSELRFNKKHTYENMVNQYELQLAPLPTLSISTVYNTTDQFNIDKTDPLMDRKLTYGRSTSLLTALKFAPLKFLSTELSYSLDDGNTYNLVSAEALSYGLDRNFNRKYEALVRTSITEKFSTDSKYSYVNSIQHYESGSSEANSETHTASLKLYININPALLVYISGAWIKTLDLLPSSAYPLSYSLSPGCGFTLKNDIARIDGDYLFEKSFFGQPSEMATATFQTRVQPNQYIALNLKWNQETSWGINNYRATELIGN